MPKKTPEEHFAEMQTILEEYNCIPLTLVNKTTPMYFRCKCGLERTCLYKDFKKRNGSCRNCNNIAFHAPVKEEEIIDENGEQWKSIKGGWISSFGNFKNPNGKLLTLCPKKSRFHVNGKHEYARRLVAKAFKIENHEKIDNPDQKWVVSHRDNNPFNNRLDNLYIRPRSEVNSINGKLSSKMTKPKDLTLDDVKNLEFKLLPELLTSYHRIYENGEIWNGTRFLQFSTNDKKYLKAVNLNYNGKSFSVHRLVCFAFHPMPNLNDYKEYYHLQVNHKDGNTFNNHKDNLEWIDQSKNIQHAYDTKLNKKTRAVIQMDKITHQFIAEHSSIASASKSTGDTERLVRNSAQGKNTPSSVYYWEFKNPEESAEYTAKYAK